MKLRTLSGLFVVIILMALIIPGCTQDTTTPTKATTSTTTATSKTTQTTTQSTTPISTTTQAAEWWDKFGEPQYGGTITVRTTFVNLANFDPTAGMMGGGGFASNVWGEGLAFVDWTLDRDIWAFPTGFTPLEYLQGLILESWEQTDPSTITLHLRQGIKWHDKAPVNGREMDAEDLQLNFDRILGSGSGYSMPNPMFAQQLSTIKRVVAVDKYTAEVQLKQPVALGQYQLFGAMLTYVPSEWIKATESGEIDSADWHYITGTSPWMMDEFEAGTKMVFKANPNYYGYDERYPENKLPYAEELVQLAVPDPAASMAAMRTGKIDVWTDAMGCMTWQAADTLLKTNPDVQLFYQPRPGGVLTMRCDTPPFDDIRVRKALNMAIDRQVIAESHYGGLSDGNPLGIIGPAIKGWAAAYEDWPQDLKDEYEYNPEAAKQLLADAGYPSGFKTNAVASSNQDQELVQILKSYFNDIGVDMEIKVMDPPTYSAFTAAGKQDQMLYSDGMAGLLWAPTQTLSYLISQTVPQLNSTFNYDAAYDDLYAQITSTADPAEMERLSREADLYAIKQHWMVTVLASNTQVAAVQPWIKGYSGEIQVDNSWTGALRARIWIDQATKAKMQ